MDVLIPAGFYLPSSASHPKLAAELAAELERQAAREEQKKQKAPAAAPGLSAETGLPGHGVLHADPLA